MSNQSKKHNAFAPALGLIIGGGVAVIIAVLANLNMAITIIFGAGLGLVIGSMLYGLKKN